MPKRRGVLLALALLLPFVACKGALPGRIPPTPTPLPAVDILHVPTYEVKRGDVVREVELVAWVVPALEVDLFVRVDGRVKEVHVTAGSMVKAGDLLAELDTEDLRRQMAQAELDLATAQADLAAAQAEADFEGRLAEIELNIAQLQLEAARLDTRAGQVAVAEASLEQAQVDVQRAQAAYDLIAYQPGASATAQALALQRATLAHRVAEANCQAALEAQAQQAVNVKILEQRRARAQLLHDRIASDTSAQSQNRIERATLAVERIKAQIENAEIRAPFAGQISSCSIFEGRTQMAFQPALTLSDLSTLELASTSLLDKDMPFLAEGLPVEIIFAARPDQPVPGTIRQLPYPHGSGPRGESGQMVDRSIRVALDKAPPALGLRDKATIRVELGRASNTLYLPPPAAHRFEGRTFAIVQDADGRQHRVDVTTGLETPERLEIKSGLREGQTVLGR